MLHVACCMSSQPTHANAEQQPPSCRTAKPTEEDRTISRLHRAPWPATLEPHTSAHWEAARYFCGMSAECPGGARLPVDGCRGGGGVVVAAKRCGLLDGRVQRRHMRAEIGAELDGRPRRELCGRGVAREARGEAHELRPLHGDRAPCGEVVSSRGISVCAYAPMRACVCKCVRECGDRREAGDETEQGAWGQGGGGGEWVQA